MIYNQKLVVKKDSIVSGLKVNVWNFHFLVASWTTTIIIITVNTTQVTIVIHWIYERFMTHELTFIKI